MEINVEVTARLRATKKPKLHFELRIGEENRVKDREVNLRKCTPI